MALSKAALARELTKIQRTFDNGIRLFKGQLFDLAEPITNCDGSYPWVRQITIGEDASLALEPDYRVNDEVYQLSLPVPEDPPDEDFFSDTFWVVVQGGTPKRVKPLSKRVRSQGANYLVSFVYRMENTP